MRYMEHYEEMPGQMTDLLGIAQRLLIPGPPDLPYIHCALSSKVSMQ